jgi:thiol-disulfide isomerase/thioredoxin
MKLFYTFLIGLFFLNIGNAQIVYQEDFENGMPDGYIVVDRDGNTVHPNVGWVGNEPWIFSGGIAISTSWYNPPAASDDWMITSEIELPAIDDPEEQQIRLIWQERSPDANYRDGYVIYINDDPTQTDPESFTTEVFSTPGAETEWTLKQIDLTEYAGKTVRLAYVNNSNDKFLLYIDNITILSPTKSDMAMVSVNTPTYVKTTQEDFSVSLQSLGFQMTETFDLGYAVDGGTPVITTINDAGFDFLDLNDFTITIDGGLSAGPHTVDFWVDNVGGTNADLNDANDLGSKNFYAYGPDSETSRTTLLEVFTSSTCPPCAPGNEKINEVVDGMTEKPILLKYQQDFPGTGDPYTTDETVARRNFYGINAIPETRIDGSFNALNPNNLTESMVTSARNEGALVTINAMYTLFRDEQKIRVYGSMTPNVDLLPGTAGQFIIKEMVTSNNEKDNGETEFDNVVKKMIGGAAGIDLGGKTAGETVDFDYTFEFKGNYRLPSDGQAANRINLDTEHSVEVFDNLAATVFVEFPADEFVMQAAEADFVNNFNELAEVNDFNIYPNPVAGSDVNIEFNLEEQNKVQILITDMVGRTVKTLNLGELQEGNHQNRIDVSELQNGVYDISVLTGSNSGISTLLHIAR